MKKYIVIALLTLMIIPFQSIKAQYGNRQVVADFYYGYSILSSNASLTYSGQDINLSQDRFGPIGGRIEYIFESNLSIGAEVNFRKNNLELDYVSFIDSLPYHISKKSEQMRVMGRLSYHFVNDEQFDAYIGMAGGYVNREFSFEAEEAGVDFDLGSLIEFPIAARAYIGGRYFFIPNLGINVEMGIGGGNFITGGVTLGF